MRWLRKTACLFDGSNSHRKVSRRPDNGGSNGTTPIKAVRPFKDKLGMFSEKGDGWVRITIPAITVAESNAGVKKVLKINGKKKYKAEHWSEKHHRHKKQKGQVHLLLRPLRSLIKLPCLITLTRYAPKKLDRFDNLPMAFKWILDAICEVITDDYRPGRADNSIENEIDVIYKQIVSSDYGAKIHIQNISK